MENMDKEITLQVENLELWFDNDYGSKKILNGISFDIYKGETLGIVGESGCGKSVTSLSIMRLLQSPPARIKGSIRIDGKELLTLTEKQMQAIRGNRISMIFQEPMTSLNPLFSIGDQLIETFMQHQGLSKSEAWEKGIEMLRMVRIPLPEQRMKEYPYQLSGGMRQRVMIAMALACRPRLLIADEPTTALDVTIQAQVLDVLKRMQKNHNTALLLITHDLSIVANMADTICVMYCGKIVEKSPAYDLFKKPYHPYTKGLLGAIPKLSDERHVFVQIPDSVPNPMNKPKGCYFHPRCAYATDKCRECMPPLRSVGDGRMVRCFHCLEEV